MNQINRIRPKNINEECKLLSATPSPTVLLLSTFKQRFQQDGAAGDNSQIKTIACVGLLSSKLTSITEMLLDLTSLTICPPHNQMADIYQARFTFVTQSQEPVIHSEDGIDASMYIRVGIDTGIQIFPFSYDYFENFWRTAKFDILMLARKLACARDTSYEVFS